MSASSLASRLIKSSGKSMGTILSVSNMGDKRVINQTDVPILNVMLGGDLDGGITSGVTQVIGDSRTFKTNICVEVSASFLEADENAVVVFFDCEFGGMKAFKKRLKPADLNRVIHMPFEDLEDLKFQMTKMLEDVKEGEKVLFFIDSISQVASKKEVDNAIKSNEAADLTRAREMNSFFRIITPKLNIRNIPCFAINSFYEDTTSNYAEVIVKGGKQNFLSSDSIWFVTRSQEKDDNTKELLGWNFNYSMMKSRFCKEKSKMSIRVTYEGGIDPLSSMIELSRESGFLLMPTSGFYQFNEAKLPGVDQRKYRMKELLLDPRLFKDTIAHPEFRLYVRKKFSLEEMGSGVSSEVVDLETGEISNQ
jgi:RecA/RadA recombinase